MLRGLGWRRRHLSPDGQLDSGVHGYSQCVETSMTSYDLRATAYCSGDAVCAFRGSQIDVVSLRAPLCLAALCRFAATLRLRLINERMRFVCIEIGRQIIVEFGFADECEFAQVKQQRFRDVVERIVAVWRTAISANYGHDDGGELS